MNSYLEKYFLCTPIFISFIVPSKWILILQPYIRMEALQEKVDPARWPDFFHSWSNSLANGSLYHFYHSRIYLFIYLFIIVLFLTQPCQLMENSHIQHLISMSSSPYMCIHLLHGAIGNVHILRSQSLVLKNSFVSPC